MKQFSEYVSLGHPDKIADYISQYLLDRYIERDPLARYAVEVQIKDNFVTLGGEVSSTHNFDENEIQNFVRAAVSDIGYTEEYQNLWGLDNTICGDSVFVNSFISQQSRDIAVGLDGWGDQGIFFGYAKYSPETSHMPLDHTLAKRLCKSLFEYKIGGLDIKTQLVMNDDKVEKVIVAIPLIRESRKQIVIDFVREFIKGDYELIVNGTGKYIMHSSVADCGTTGRKLAVDFYGGNCKIGGGSPWTKDASKADLSLNLYARKLAKEYCNTYQKDINVALACCIGKQEVDISVTGPDVCFEMYDKIDLNPATLRRSLGLDKPIYASMCRWGLFGEFQNEKLWEAVV